MVDAVQDIARESVDQQELGAPEPGSPEPSSEDLAEARRHRIEGERKVRYAAVLKTIPPRQRQARLSDALATYERDSEKVAAVEAARELARAGHVTERGMERFALLLTGTYGVGKTWLATAVWKERVWCEIAAEGEEGGPLTRFVWTTFDDFIRDVQASYHPKAETPTSAVLARYRDARVLLLDDVGDLDMGEESDDRRRLLYTVLNHRSNWMLPTLLTSNLSPDQIRAQFGGRSVQRVIEMCALVGMGGANLRLDRALLNGGEVSR